MVFLFASTLKPNNMEKPKRHLHSVSRHVEAILCEAFPAHLSSVDISNSHSSLMHFAAFVSNSPHSQAGMNYPEEKHHNMRVHKMINIIIFKAWAEPWRVDRAEVGGEDQGECWAPALPYVLCSVPGDSTSLRLLPTGSLNMGARTSLNSLLTLKSNLLSALTSMLALSSFVLWMNEKFSLWVIKKYAGFSHTHLSARVDGGWDGGRWVLWCMHMQQFHNEGGAKIGWAFKWLTWKAYLEKLDICVLSAFCMELFSWYLFMDIFKPNSVEMINSP